VLRSRSNPQQAHAWHWVRARLLVDDPFAEL